MYRSNQTTRGDEGGLSQVKRKEYEKRSYGPLKKLEAQNSKVAAPNLISLFQAARLKKDMAPFRMGIRSDVVLPENRGEERPNTILRAKVVRIKYNRQCQGDWTSTREREREGPLTIYLPKININPEKEKENKCSEDTCDTLEEKSKNKKETQTTDNQDKSVVSKVKTTLEEQAMHLI